jgi:hypothetical protein
VKKKEQAMLRGPVRGAKRTMRGLRVWMIPLLFLLAAPAPARQDLQRISAGGMTIEARFPAPAGYARTEAPAGSFAAYLRRLPLKAHGAEVKLFDGRVKPDHGVYAAVVDLPIGRRDLHQCADAIIRLRAEYLFSRQRYDEIRFHFDNGFLAEYRRWRRGERIEVRGGDVRWERLAEAGDDARSRWRFLETVFAYAGTASLSRELQNAAASELEIGDIFIQPGHPGHAVIVVDAAERRDDESKVFLLAQSYMPAQEIQVLRNPDDSRLSPWYAAAFGAVLRTPQWTFAAGDRKRFAGQ